MNNYIEVPSSQAYRLVNIGPVILVSTCSKDGQFDIAPMAWNCPIHKAPTRILVAIGKRHQTYRNIKDTGYFIICIPHESQAKMVMGTGAVSGKNTDKFSMFKIQTFNGAKLKAKIPVGCLAYIECKLFKTFDPGGSELIIGECIYAAADKNGFNKRLLPENKDGKTLHHLGGRDFVTTSDYVIST